MDDSDTVIDACCLINLAAAGDLARILPATGLTWYLPRAVEAQGVYIRHSTDPSHKQVRRIDLSNVIAIGAIRRAELDPDDLEIFVELAAVQRDEADTMALAIAIGRGWTLATDDRKLQRLARDQNARTISTPGIMKRLAKSKEFDMPEMLRRIRDLARYSPRGDDSDARWWRSLLDRT